MLVLVALFVTLIPTTIGALLSAIGIAGMDRLVRFNVLAMSGAPSKRRAMSIRCCFDKTGTITLGKRQANEFVPLSGVSEPELADAAQLASLAGRDAGRPLDRCSGQGQIRHPRSRHVRAQRAFIPFSAQTRISGIDSDGASIRKGAVDAVLAFVQSAAHSGSDAAWQRGDHDGRGFRSPRGSDDRERIARSGGTPLAVAKDGKLLGVIHLKDIVKGGIRERFAACARWASATVMITGDNAMNGGDRPESGGRRFPRAGDHPRPSSS